MKRKLIRIGFGVFLFIIGFLVGGGLSKSMAYEGVKNYRSSEIPTSEIR